MDVKDDTVHVTPVEARGGETPHIMRYVLAISLLLVVVGLGLVWAIVGH